MNNKFFTHKFLTILSIFIILLFNVFVLNVKASTIYTYNCPTTDCNFTCDIYYPDDVPVFDLELGSDTYHNLHYFFIVNDNGIYRLISYNMKGTVYDDGYFYMENNIVRFNHHRAIDKWYYDNDSKQWISDGYSWNSYTLPENANFVVSSCNIYNDVDKSSVFFQSAPLGITQTLVGETEKVQIAEQLKIMIVGFLKYLIVFVISLIAFWKGWQFLSTQLRKA